MKTKLTRHPVRTARGLLAAIGLVAFQAQASCGSAFCSVDTHWDAQGLTHGEGLSLDLHYSWAKADRLRAGSQRISAEAPSASGEELENKRTINQLLSANFEYAINPRWNLAVDIPLVIRDHAHTLDSTAGTPIDQSAKFSQLGDIRVVGKYKFDSGNPFAGYGLRFGLKLPTGAIDRIMSPADPADPATPYKLERGAQPGSGSTDLILGAYRYSSTPGSAWSWFASGEMQSAFRTRDHYRPGNSVTLTLGGGYTLSPAATLLLQVNALHRGRDGGDNANPASGGRFLNLSPGLSYTLTHQTQVYGFIQMPLHQYANTDPATPGSGQLTVPWSLALGLHHHF
ncbi:MAG: hypothetical protein CVU17_08495 [Betaproteobacteria bacterium HGW-Betaproteobacteria-11]|nr:MAG: hypothetical protein CVU17_08495 [Betaproteobacteria bacterium HGW-Betaproteobacteria-11]